MFESNSLKWIILLVFYVDTVYSLCSLLNEQPIVNTEEKVVYNLIKRSIGMHVNRFTVTINKSLEFRSYNIQSISDKQISIYAYDAIAASKGFHQYLKYYLHKDVYWYNRNVLLPTDTVFPLVSLQSVSESNIIYYQNVCSWGYSFVWWNFDKWISHIEWMAMMGISLTIAPIQEQLWYETYLEIGLTEKEIIEHFSGPAFSPWQRMGNIRGWAGPLSSSFRSYQQNMQKNIIKLQRSFGMKVAIPGFSGHLPAAIKRLFPNIKFQLVDRWNNFPDKYCCMLFLEPKEELFKQISSKFLNKVIEAYGTDHVYFADPFNELLPRIPEPSYMSMIASNLYQAMHLVDSKAIWLLQGWMFVKNLFWTEELIKAFLTSVPKGRLLILDLQSEQFPQYERTHSFYGQPFIWCMLHNFGGTLGMHGSVDIINTRIAEARNIENSTMVGIGITSEGINQNYVIYAFALERGWLKANFNTTEWFNVYANVRYGISDENLQKAWNLLRESVYSFHGWQKIHGKYLLARRPSTRLNPWIWYDPNDIYKVWSRVLQVNSIVPKNHYTHYEQDVVDITRQFLQILFELFYINLMNAYKRKNVDRFDYLGNMMIKIFKNLEKILATNSNFLLGAWLEDAKRFATSATEKKLLEFNARNQITTWGPNGQIVDYATKQWSGVVEDYYQPRWHLFINCMRYYMINNQEFNNSAFAEKVFMQVENAFNYDTKLYPSNVPCGMSYHISKNIYETWTQTFVDDKFKKFVSLKLPMA